MCKFIVRNAYLYSVLKYQIDHIQKYIGSFQHSHYQVAIPHSKLHKAQCQRSLIGNQSSSDCTSGQFIYSASEHTVVLLSFLSQFYICWVTGTGLEHSIC